MESEDRDKKDRQYAMLQWLNRNRRTLLNSYKNQYIAYNADGLISHSENLQEVLAQANASQKEYVIYLSCYAAKFNKQHYLYF